MRRRTSIRPHTAKKQCLGIPICDTDARVINPDTLAELGPRETGEIVSHGPQMFAGYWKNPPRRQPRSSRSTANASSVPAISGYCDEDGYFFIVDRLKRMINASGYKVWPAEVEAMLYRHPTSRRPVSSAPRTPRAAKP